MDAFSGPICCGSQVFSLGPFRVIPKSTMSLPQWHSWRLLLRALEISTFLAWCFQKVLACHHYNKAALLLDIHKLHTQFHRCHSPYQHLSDWAFKAKDRLDYHKNFSTYPRHCLYSDQNQPTWYARQRQEEYFKVSSRDRGCFCCANVRLLKSVRQYKCVSNLLKKCITWQDENWGPCRDNSQELDRDSLVSGRRNANLW